MTVYTGDIIRALEDLAPPAAACEWDNPGLLVGSREQTLTRVYVALDAGEHAVREAAEQGCGLIITHHPVIFRGMKAINEDSGLGRKLIELIRKNISVYSMHTNFDSCPGGMADIVCERLGLCKLAPIERSSYAEPNSFLLEKAREKGMESGRKEKQGEKQEGKQSGEQARRTEEESGDAAYGIGFVAELPEEMSLRELAILVKERFSLPYLQYYDAGKRIKRIACCPGSGKGELAAVRRTGADVFLSGDLGHHEGLDYMEEGISLMDAGHYGLEHIFIPCIGAFLREKFPRLQVIEEELHFPASVLTE